MPAPTRRLPNATAMIVAPQPEAVEAGADILRAGGSAVDAVIACALTQGVVDPMMCGVGGLGVLQVHDPATGRSTVLDGLSTCPARCTPDMWADAFERECPDGFGYVLRGHVNELGHGAVTTPGIVRTMDRAHRTWGRLPWADLFRPAIGFAQTGWIVRPHVYTVFTMNEAAYGRLSYTAKLSHTADGRAIYLRPDGTPKRPGDRVENPALAETLACIARDGAETFYTGALAKRIVADMAAHGGLLSAEDLANFQPRQLDPIRIDYRGRTLSVPPPPAGGIVVAQMLRILERFDLVALGHNSADYVRVLAEAMKIAGRDREEHIGDPAFVPPPLDLLLSDAYADQCAARIGRGEKTPLTRVTNDAKDIRITAPEGSIVNASFPAACGVRYAINQLNYGIVQAILAQAMPGRIPAAGAAQATILAVSIQDPQTGQRRAGVIQPMIGGSGARPGKDGIDATDFSLGALANTPTEAVENELALLIRHYGIVPDSGGPGRFRGGLAARLDFEVLQPDSILTARGMDRYRFQPWGLAGGRAGATGDAWLDPDSTTARRLGKITMLRLEPGQVFSVSTPAGGGYGNPWQRDPALVAADLRSGFVTPVAAARDYGVVVSPDGQADLAATGQLRTRLNGERPATGHTAWPATFDGGAARAAHDAMVPPSVADELAELLFSLPPAARYHAKQRVFARLRAIAAERPAGLVPGDVRAAWS